jgi:hypothetical protein
LLRLRKRRRPLLRNQRSLRRHLFDVIVRVVKSNQVAGKLNRRAVKTNPLDKWGRCFRLR